MAVLDPFGLVDFGNIVEQAKRMRFVRVVEHLGRGTLVHVTNTTVIFSSSFNLRR